MKIGKALVLRTEEPEPVAPVIVGNQDHPLSIFNVISTSFHATYLPSADKFWKSLKNAFKPDILETWRPRVQRRQHKMLAKV